MSQEIPNGPPMGAVHAPKNRLLLHFSLGGPPFHQDSVLDVISYLVEIDLSHFLTQHARRWAHIRKPLASKELSPVVGSSASLAGCHVGNENH